MATKLDYTLESPEERNELVKKIVEENPDMTNRYKEIIADYLVLCMEKKEKREKRILTDNRMTTINKRETSFQGFADKLENGEDGIYNFITNDKNIIFSPAVCISKRDLEEIPDLAKLREAIEIVEEQSKTATGKRAFDLKKTIIEMRRDQYVIKNSYRKPIFFIKTMKSISKLDLSEKVKESNGEVSSDGLISLFDPSHVLALLCNYSILKEDTYSNLDSDARWLLIDLEESIDECLKEKHPLYYDLIIYKIDGMTNVNIQAKLQEDYGTTYSVEYLSSLYRNKIPKMIAEHNQNKWLVWHYTIEEKGAWKRCSRCGQIKLAHNRFFSKNSTSKDKFYSICKMCRNKKTK